MTKTGKYRITFYDKYGEKQRTKDKLYCDHYTNAVKVGQDIVETTPDYSSFTVDRRLYNSLDNHNDY